MYAMGYPVAFDASAEAHREPCVDLYRAVCLGAGLERELHVALADDSAPPRRLERQGHQHVILAVRYRLRGRHDDVVPCVHPHAEDVLHVADYLPVVLGVPHHLILDLLPVADVLLDQNLVRHAQVQTSLHYLVQLLQVPRNASSPPAQGVGHAHYHGEAQPLHGRAGILKRVRRAALGAGDAYLLHRLLEELPVLGYLDPVNLGAQHLHAILRERTRPG